MRIAVIAPPWYTVPLREVPPEERIGDPWYEAAHDALSPHRLQWPEPFGLVMIEAMAWGTPVIAWRIGMVWGHWRPLDDPRRHGSGRSVL